MHDAAYRWMERQAAERGPFVSVLEIGSRDVNGSVRGLFPGAVYEGVDIEPGTGVDYVCDASVELPRGPYDAVVATEVFEHTPGWPDIVANAYVVLMPGGTLLVTAARPGRAPHSASDGGHLRGGEYYANVEPDHLYEAMRHVGFAEISIDDSSPGDVYAAGVKGD